ncbi:MAG: methionyl-tRNA formyltransferase [Flavobacteriales bacterium]|nr:methionyl-tRNA formyltransferase [Flavobacteriales bacterium]MCB9192262.1 methionyl-tRNA formyltransferase [Flavobacteriales bacterium]
MAKQRIVFMGTPDFAVASLRALLEADAKVVGVITAPDRPAGRGMKLQPSAVKTFALENDLKVLQPTNLKSEEFLSELRALEATLQIVVAFRMLPEVVWNMPTNGTFNLHASLLPQYRGAAPINWAIINGEKESGVTTFFLQHKIDTGDIILQERVPISDDMTAGELHDALMEVGSKLVVKTLQSIEGDNCPSTPQQTSSELKEAPKIFKETCQIYWSRPIDEVYNLIRGLSPYPAAFTTVSNGSESLGLKIFRATKTTGIKTVDAGQILVKNDNLFISCGNGWLQILELQLAGKRRMKTDELLRGTDLATFTII